jgi:hypothetical protein
MMLDLLTPDFYRYIFSPIKPRQKLNDSFWWIRIPLCRYRGHPAGVSWFNPGALEPDMRCKNCGDDLG